MIKSRHYISSIIGYGIVFLPDRKQPTLDIYLGKHVFVTFWKRNND